MRAPSVCFIPRSFSDQDGNFSFFQTPGPSPALDGTDSAGYGLIENHFIHGRNIQPFFSYGSGNQNIKLSRGKFIQNFFLLFLGKPKPFFLVCPTKMWFRMLSWLIFCAISSAESRNWVNTIILVSLFLTKVSRTNSCSFVILGWTVFLVLTLR